MSSEGLEKVDIELNIPKDGPNRASEILVAAISAAEEVCWGPDWIPYKGAIVEVEADPKLLPPKYGGGGAKIGAVVVDAPGP